MNILTGLHARDEGTILIDGKETYFTNPKEAERQGIAFIHQELNVWPDMTVLDNLFIGREMSSPVGFLKYKEMKALAKKQFQRLAVDIPLNVEAGECSVGQQQMIEIAKALLSDAKVIIMDEPTSALTEREIQKLFEVIASLKKMVFPSFIFRTGWRKYSPSATGLRSCATGKRWIRKIFRTRTSTKS